MCIKLYNVVPVLLVLNGGERNWLTHWPLGDFNP